jgi:hypothetical protein
MNMKEQNLSLCSKINIGIAIALIFGGIWSFQMKSINLGPIDTHIDILLVVETSERGSDNAKGTRT